MLAFWTLAGFLPGVVLAKIYTSWVILQVPVCHDHRHHWLFRRAIAGSLLLLPLIPIGVIFVLVPGADSRFNPVYHGSIIAWIVAMLVWIAGFVIAEYTAIRPIEITKDSITLTNVSPRFVGPLEGLRACGYSEKLEDLPLPDQSRDEIAEPHEEWALYPGSEIPEHEADHKESFFEKEDHYGQTST